MRLAAIDIGTNSVHLLVVDVGDDGSIKVVEKARAQVELGSGGLGTGRLAPDAMQRGLDAIAVFARGARSLGVAHVTAAATSAVREASNGKAFRKAVKEKTGIHVRVISGVEEARLIYMGVRRDLDLSSGPAMLVDLGGGSVELAVAGPAPADRPDAGLLTAHSLPLGHIRMTESWLRSDPISAREIKDVRARVLAALAPVRGDLLAHGLGSVVGTSGAIRTLARMATLARGEPVPVHADGMVLGRAELSAFVGSLVGCPRSDLDSRPGMDPRRRATLPAAAVVTHALLKELGAKSLVTSSRSLRDGLVQDWMLRNADVLRPRQGDAGPRERSVLGLMDRYGVHRPHARKVAELAVSLFDDTAELHGLQEEDRSLLHQAALLHDLGHHIAGEDHNRHGEYLIRNTRMYGFTAQDIAVLAMLVRYHRGALPKRQHTPYGSLPRSDRRRVRMLAGLLRVADALDRSHHQPIERVTAQVEPNRVTIRALARAPAHVERWAAERRRRLLSNAFGREVVVQVVGATPAEPPVSLAMDDGAHGVAP